VHFSEVFILQGLHWVLFVSVVDKRVTRGNSAKIDIFLRRSVDSIELTKRGLGSAHSKGVRGAIGGTVARDGQLSERPKLRWWMDVAGSIADASKRLRIRQ